MRELSYHDFTARTRHKKILEATVHLTYRCNLKCIHCYTDIGFDHGKELSLRSWEKIIDQMHQVGCLWLTFSGGEPFLYNNFLPLYRYAFNKGMRLTVFTNATRITPEAMRILGRCRPFSVEVSIYGASCRVHESITQVPGSFACAMNNLAKLVALRVPVIIKTVGLRQNRQEILKVKSLSEKLLGKGAFKFDSFVLPRLNGDTTACKYRLAPRQIIAIEASDRDMVKQRFGEFLKANGLRRPADFLYQCAGEGVSFFIDPDGRLKFCALSDAHSFDLNRIGLKIALTRGIERLRREKFKTNSKCKACWLRGYCYFCPARAFLETGDKERASGYFCRLAEARKKHYEAVSSRMRIRQ